MKNKQNIIIYSSMAILFIITVATGLMDGKNISMVILSAVVVFIPAIYSAIPIIENCKLKKNRSKNRLSENTFTNREEDLKQILDKLLIKEHIIEISGDGVTCGKTWIAKRLFDCINHPEDLKQKYKCPYKVAYYIDLEEYNNRQLEDFFENSIINSNVVLIFDNVQDIGHILSKQTRYHFQLVYILKKPSENNFFNYKISRFHEQHIMELQEKIKNNFPGIDNISEQEIHILYNLTDGNIGKIHSVLSKQTSVRWLKDIAIRKRTEYDDALDRIELTLQIGKYAAAKQELEVFEANNKLYFEENNDLYYKYMLIKADCEHLLNNYKDAITLLSIIENEPFCSHNRGYELERFKAHYYKHLWKCNESLEVLYNIRMRSFTAKVDSLGILLAKYFINDLYVPNSERTSLEEFYNVYIDAENSKNTTQDSANLLKLERNAVIYHYYKEHPENPNELINSISRVIEVYKAQNNRLLANAYFIRGEIYRVYGIYENAAHEYNCCLSVTDDNNIRIQANLMIYYLTECKKQNLDFSLLSKERIIELCEHNTYAKKVYHRINSIYLGDPTGPELISCFDSRIMPIL